MEHIAHVIRTQSSKVFRSVNSLKTRHRWCLTGTPIQNSMKDFESLIKFLRVDPLDNSHCFRQIITDPVTRISDDGIDKLRRLVQAISLRRMKADIADDLGLPNRRKIVQPVELDTEERALYNMIKRSSAFVLASTTSTRSCFQTILKLRQVSSHGSDLLPPSLVEHISKAMAENTFNSIQVSACESCNTVTSSSELAESLSCAHQICSHCMLSGTDKDALDEPTCPLCTDSSMKMSKETRQEMRNDIQRHYRPSSKVKALMRKLETDRLLQAADGGEPIKR